jgi:hypothetical protein
MKKIYFAFFILASVIPLSLFAQDARKIAEKAANSIEFESMEMTSILKIYDNRGNVRERKVAAATKTFEEVTKTLIKFISPPDVRGTSMLIYDYEDKPDDMWIYLPALRRIRRIVSSEKGRSFMGSEFTNADMSKPNLNDFTYNMQGTVTINDKICWKIESVCKDINVENENGFSKKMAYIEKSNYLTHKVEYYDFDGELHKIMTIGNYQKQSNGKYFAYHMNIENLQNKRKSEMLVEQFQLHSALNEDSFSTSNLDK